MGNGPTDIILEELRTTPFHFMYWTKRREMIGKNTDIKQIRDVETELMRYFNSFIVEYEKFDDNVNKTVVKLLKETPTRIKWHTIAVTILDGSL